MIKRKIIVLILMYLLYSLCYAEYKWPVSEDTTSSLFTKFIDNKEYLIFEGEGKIFSISDGTVLFTRKKNLHTGLPNLVEIITERGLLISYLFIDFNVNIGDKIHAGDVIGSFREGNEFFLRINDTNLGRDVDPFTILPELDRWVVIKLQSMTFTTENIFTNETEVINIGRIIKGGESKIELIISAKDRSSHGYIIPKTVWIDIAEESFIVTMDDLLSQSENYTILPSGMIKIILPSVDIPYGYFDIFITVKTPLQGMRILRFNTFAASHKQR